MKKFMIMLLLSISPRMLAMEDAVQPEAAPELKLNVPQTEFFDTVLERARAIRDNGELVTFCAEEVQPAYNAKEAEFQEKAAAQFAALRSTLATYIKAERLEQIVNPFYRLNANYETLFNQLEKKPAGWVRTLTFRESSTVGQLDAIKAALISLQATYKSVIDTQAALETYVNDTLETAIIKASEPSALQTTLNDLQARADALFASLRTASILGLLFGSREGIATDTAETTAVPTTESANSNNTETPTATK